MNTDRERSILKILVHDKKVTVKDLSTRLFTSEPSIRRDLVSLERQHLLKRIYGGAILDDNDVSRQRIPFLLRELEQSQEKVTIAKKAASLVGDGAVVFLDASSSAFNLIPFLALKENITVITNGIRALMKLCEYNRRAVSTGGILFKQQLRLLFPARRPTPPSPGTTRIFSFSPVVLSPTTESLRISPKPKIISGFI